MEAMPRGIPGDPISEAGSEAAVRWSSYNVFHHIFLAEQTSIKGLLCLLYIRKKKMFRNSPVWKYCKSYQVSKSTFPSHAICRR